MLGFMQFGGSGQNSSPDNGDAEPPRRPGLHLLDTNVPYTPTAEEVGDVFYSAGLACQLVLPTADSLAPEVLPGYHLTFSALAGSDQLSRVTSVEAASPIQLGDLYVTLDANNGYTLISNSDGASITFVYFASRWLAVSVVGSWIVALTTEGLVPGGGGGGVLPN